MSFKFYVILLLLYHSQLLFFAWWNTFFFRYFLDFFSFQIWFSFFRKRIEFFNEGNKFLQQNIRQMAPCAFAMDFCFSLVF